MIREPKRIGEVQYTEPKIQLEIINELRNQNFKIEEFIIDIDDYKKYMRDADYKRFPRYIKGINPKYLPEKSLEHYLATKLLFLTENDIYIDIANADSPTVEIYKDLFKCKTYRQDLIYPKGIHGNIIGGSASDLPISNNFATKIALHCSFEHFESNLDILFIKEANRILKTGGKLCILPFYLYNRHVIRTDPASLSRRSIKFDKNAEIYCVKYSRERHGRYYDAPQLIKRIRNNLNGLKLTIYVVKNENLVNKLCYIKFIALFEKLRKDMN